MHVEGNEATAWLSRAAIQAREASSALARMTPDARDAGLRAARVRRVAIVVGRPLRLLGGWYRRGLVAPSHPARTSRAVATAGEQLTMGSRDGRKQWLRRWTIEGGTRGSERIERGQLGRVTSSRHRQCHEVRSKLEPRIRRSQGPSSAPSHGQPAILSDRVGPNPSSEVGRQGEK